MKRYTNYIIVLLFLSFTHLGYSQSIYCDELTEIIKKANTPFPFGVCSGDPSGTSIILATNIWPSKDVNQVQWLIATDTLLKSIVQAGTETITEQDGYAVKKEIEDLLPGTTYYYQFSYQGIKSPIGRTKTINTNNPSNLRFAVASCSNYESGWFYAYRAIAEEKNIDAVLHLGDYIYEYHGNHFSKTPLIRNHLPACEIVSLSDYRTRYAQYRMDPDLQEMHRLHPVIAIWDDHEFANNCYANGVESRLGEWDQRKKDGKKAYFEWIPVKNNAESSVRRAFSFGNLADLYMLDGRLEARSPQLVNSMDTCYLQKERVMLGAEQANWLISNVVNSKAKWKIMGNQVIFSELDFRKIEKRGRSNMDMWQGYPIERNRIFDSLYANQVRNLVIVTGDAHTSWGFHLRKNIRDTKHDIGAEFVTPSITSANLDEFVSWWKVLIAKSYLKGKKHTPHLQYLDLTRHGYMLLDLNESKAECTWKYVKNIHTSKYKRGKSVKMDIGFQSLQGASLPTHKL